MFKGCYLSLALRLVSLYSVTSLVIVADIVMFTVQAFWGFLRVFILVCKSLISVSVYEQKNEQQGTRNLTLEDTKNQATHAS